MGLAVILAGGLVLCSWGLSFFILRCARSWPNRLAVVFAMLLVVQVAAAAAMFVAGANVEFHHRWWSLVSAKLPEPSQPFDVGFEAKGDPSLAGWLQSQAPRYDRPKPADAAAFSEWQGTMRRYLRAEVFELPDERISQPVSSKTLSSVDLAGGIRRKLISYESFDETTIPAYLFEPKSPGQHPAVVVIAGHGQGIVETAGLVDSYQNSVARRLAEAGYVVLTPELRGFGYLGARINNEHRITAYNAILGGSFLKAVLVKDMERAVNMLLALPTVDPQKVAITGVSYGGELSLLYAALDERVGAVVVQGHGVGLGNRPGKSSASHSYPSCPHYCHIVPGQNRHFSREDLLMLIPPRPLLVVRGMREGPFSPELVKLAEQAYESLGRTDDLSIVRARGGHGYYVEPTRQFLDQVLLPSARSRK